MSYLFLDTSHLPTIGLLDSNFEWVEYKVFENNKSSQFIHHEINELLIRAGSDIKKIEAMILCSGPGSYTGMRVGEGIAQVLEWQGIETYSFYHFNVPFYMGIKKGHWVANAFKGEYFLFSWDENGINKKLINIEDLKSENYKEMYSIDKELGTQVKLVSTINLIKENSSVVFKKIVLNKQREKAYYYRTLEEEFNKSE